MIRRLLNAMRRWLRNRRQRRRHYRDAPFDDGNCDYLDRE